MVTAWALRLAQSTGGLAESEPHSKPRSVQPLSASFRQLGGIRGKCSYHRERTPTIAGQKRPSCPSPDRSGKVQRHRSLDKNIEGRDAISPVEVESSLYGVVKAGRCATITMTNPAIISALSVLAGSSLGALTPVLSNYVLQRSATQRDLVTREFADRQTLYSDFISNAARLYAEAATSNTFQINDAVGLYALVSRMRLVAPPPFVEAAETAARNILERYKADNIPLASLPISALSSGLDPLQKFSMTCRTDLLDLSMRCRASIIPAASRAA